MARSDLLINLVRAGSVGDQGAFRRTLEAIVAEERNRQHHTLAERLSEYLQPPRPNGASSSSRGPSDVPFGVVAEVHPHRLLDDLVLPMGVRAACDELIEEQQRSDLLRSHNLEPRNRVLAAGAPGNGKTSLAEALAGSLAVPLLIVRYEAVIASYLGETAVRLARLFEYVRTRRCVLFFDEFDTIGKERGDEHETGEIKRVVSSLLLNVDALPSYVVVVAATNHPELLDRAVWRRFQLRLELPIPGRKDIIAWLSRFEQRSGIKIQPYAGQIADALKDSSFAEVNEFCLDLQRKTVLADPSSDISAIISSRLAQWRARTSVRG